MNTGLTATDLTQRFEIVKSLLDAIPADQKTPEQQALTLAFSQQSERTRAVSDALTNVFQDLEGLQEQLDQEPLASAQLRQDALDVLAQDLEIIQRLNQSVKDLPPEQSSTLSFPLRTNKLVNILSGTITEDGKTRTFEGASEIVSKYFDSLYAGQAPACYQFAEPPTVVVLGEDPIHVYGSSKLPSLTSAALSIQSAFHKPIGGSTPIACLLDIHSSPLVHWTPLPDCVRSQIPDFPNCSYSWADPVTGVDWALTVPHGGYAFGGSRDTEQYYTDAATTGSVAKLFAEDCSSWLAKILGMKATFTTWHQMTYYHHRQQPSVVPLPSDSDWSDITARLEPISIRDPQKDIKEGYVFAKTGHTALTVGAATSSGEVPVLGFSRNMPKEGFGLHTVQHVNYTPDEKKPTVYFRLKS